MQVKKKAAKKTYSAAKKGFPKTKITLEDLLALHAKTEAAQAKTEASIDRLSANIDKLIAENREMSKNLGHIGNDIGELTEFIVIPKIRLAMNATGKHTFDDIQTDRLYKKIDELGEKKTLTEVDVLLTGGKEVMAVETKTHPTIRDVKQHQERLDILRRHEELVGIKGKKLFGALVGAVIDKDVKKFALERGIYVVKIREEEEKLNIYKPEQCRIW
jgi:hypothetical protein